MKMTEINAIMTQDLESQSTCSSIISSVIFASREEMKEELKNQESTKPKEDLQPYYLGGQVKLPRSSFMKNLVGSISIKEGFNREMLPKIMRNLDVFEIHERNPSCTDYSDYMHNTYVVKRKVDLLLDINVKTIDNYFRKNVPKTHIGYVLHSKRFPKEAQTNLSLSHKYLVISLHYLKIWWESSSIMRKKMYTNPDMVWPIDYDGEQTSELEEDVDDKCSS